MVETSDEYRKRLEFQDYGHELAGVNTGRMSRFGTGAARADEITDKKRKDRAYRDALDHLLATDPEYRKLYEELGETLSSAESEADTKINAIQSALEAQQDQNQDMRDRAPKIDGKAVFRYADGRVVNQDGNEIDPDIAAGIVWHANAPNAEDYFAGLERENALQQRLNDWRNYRNDVLGGIRNRYDDRDNPMGKGDIRDAVEDIESKAPENPFARKSTEKVEPTSSPSSIAIPRLSD